MNIQPLAQPTNLKTDGRAPAAVDPSAPAAAIGGKPPAASGPVSHEALSDAVKKLNEAMKTSSQSLEFSIDDDSKKLVVKVVDQDTKEVVRQMPSEEALRIAKSIDKMQGLLLRQTA